MCPHPGAFWEPVRHWTGAPRVRGVLEASARTSSHGGGARRKQREALITLFPGLTGNPPPLAWTWVLAEAGQGSRLPHCPPHSLSFMSSRGLAHECPGDNIPRAWHHRRLRWGSGWTALSNSKPWQEPGDRHSEMSGRPRPARSKGCSLPPGQLGGGCLHRALFTAGRHTKLSLSSTGVGHQRGRREGRVEKAGRKEEERRDPRFRPQQPLTSHSSQRAL